MKPYRHDDELTLMDWFCGAGGSSQGAHAVPGVRVELAANHWAKAIESHARNFPQTDHYQGDIRDADITRWPAADLFWASPECPKWSKARAKKADYAYSLQGTLFGPAPDPEVVRSRALMEEVPLYLRAARQHGHTVLGGVVENVIDVYSWDQFDRWRAEFHKEGYRTWVIALNSMHAQPRATDRCPQSRTRFFMPYLHRSVGRVPDWDKWLRPRAWCEHCGRQVSAVQVFNKPGAEMGAYRQSYLYRCPVRTCRAVLEPDTLPASVAIDWELPGKRIGDRPAHDPLAPKTMARIGTGVLKFAIPSLVPAGGTWRSDPIPVDVPMPARTATESDGVAVPPLLIPTEGRTGKEPSPVTIPARTQTARNETGLALPPFVTTLRGGGSAKTPRGVHDALTAVTASGNHHGLVTAEPTEMLVSYYGTGRAHPVDQPIGTLTTRDRYGRATTRAVDIDAEAVAREVAAIDRISELIEKLPKREKGEPKSPEQLALEARAVPHAEQLVDAGLGSVDFRMLEPHEIGRAMAFADDYIVLGSKRQQVRQYGNAVTPNAAEVIVAALVEAITGTEMERYA